MDVHGMTMEIHGLEHWSGALDNALASEDMAPFSEDEIYEAAPQRLPFALWRFVNHVCDIHTDVVSDPEQGFSGVQVGAYYIVIHDLVWNTDADDWTPKKALREWRYAALDILRAAIANEAYEWELGAWWFQAKSSPIRDYDGNDLGIDMGDVVDATV